MQQKKSFFERNTLSNWMNSTETVSKIKSKRAVSVGNLKLNPSKFIHREVFDNNLYQKVNHFQINFQDCKKKSLTARKQYLKYSDFSSYLLNTTSKGTFQNQLHNFIESYTKYINFMVHAKDSEQIEQAADHISKSITQFLCKCLQNAMNQSAEKSEVENKFRALQKQYAIKIKQNAKEDTNMVYLSEKQIDKIDKERKQYKSFKQKISSLEFQYKKGLLGIENLAKTIEDQNKFITKLQMINSAMEKQRQVEKQSKVDMEFKLKRLKEELEVANIIKEQNLADKMKFIMNW